MASLRRLKKDIDYLVAEIINDCYMCITVNSKIDRVKIFTIIEEAVALRNELIDRANNPAEKHNKGLVKKHYYLIRENMFDGVDSLFTKLSEAHK